MIRASLLAGFVVIAAFGTLAQAKAPPSKKTPVKKTTAVIPKLDASLPVGVASDVNPGWYKYGFKTNSASVTVPCTPTEVVASLKGAPSIDKSTKIEVACRRGMTGVGFLAGFDTGNSKSGGFGKIWADAPGEQKGGIKTTQMTLAGGQRAVETDMGEMGIVLRAIELKNDEFIVLTYVNLLKKGSPKLDKARFFDSLVIAAEQ